MTTPTPRHPVTPTRRGDRRAGFTLIEVLTTILLISIVAPVAIQAVGMANTAASVAQHRTIATGLGESKLSEIMATGEWQNGGSAGSFDGDDVADYSWQSVVDTWPTSTTVNQVQVIVTWTTGRRGQESLTVATLAYAPGSVAPTSTSSSSSTGGTP